MEHYVSLHILQKEAKEVGLYLLPKFHKNSFLIIKVDF
jgi:hypothetical protein